MPRRPAIAKTRAGLFATKKSRVQKDSQEHGSSDSSEPDQSDLESQPNDEDVSEGEDDSDVKPSRALQWLDEDDLQHEVSDSESEDQSGPQYVPSKSPANESETLPFGTLLAARRGSKRPGIVSNDKLEGLENAVEETQPKRQVIREWSTKRLPDIVKRSSKHAPAEYSSKRPVTRKRTVVEVKTPKYRDPRFLPISGEFKSPKFQEQYTFLTDLRVGELATLRDEIKRARKLLKTSPQHLRADREQEVVRLELAVKRTESLVNRDKQEKTERETLKNAAKEEKEKRQLGKREWWMKKSEKRSLLMRARYDALARTQGKQAVKKAIEKRRKKISQKEKRSRPFARGPSTGWGGEHVSDEGGRNAKRRKRG